MEGQALRRRHEDNPTSMEEEEEAAAAEDGRPQSMKRIRSVQDCSLQNLYSANPPPPDCPPYLDSKQLPLWVGRTPVELTPQKVDELHDIQWRAWKEEEGNVEGGKKDYARIVEVAASVYNSSFVALNPHNAAITVGLTVDAMWHLNAGALACANTLLYGLSLLENHPSKQTIPIQFVKSAPEFMEAWAHATFGGNDDQIIESLFEFCGVYPHSGLPDVLGKHVERRMVQFMAEGKAKEAKALVKRLFEAPWAQGHKVWDEDVYWKLRLLSYICKRRARLALNGNGGSPRAQQTQQQEEPAVMKMVVLVFPKSSGRLPDRLEAPTATLECGTEFGPGELEASLAAMREAFDQFAESFLALSNDSVKWELVYKPETCVLQGATMPARPYHTEIEAPTNPNRLIAQADCEASPEFRDFLDKSKDVQNAQAVLVLWPGLKPPGDRYMLTCGGITPHGYGRRAVYMSDGPMLQGRPVWSPMWFHHETFHIMEHCFPEAPFAEASMVCDHPCFLRDQWPDHYEGQGFEWDFYFNSYRSYILDGSIRPSLAARLCRVPSEPHTHTFDVARREAATIIARLAHPGDRILLKGNVGALAFKPGALREGLVFAALANTRTGGVDNSDNNNDTHENEEPAFMAFWVCEPPCFLITLVKGGDREAHETLVSNLLASDGDALSSPRSQPSPPGSSNTVGKRSHQVLPLPPAPCARQPQRVVLSELTPELHTDSIVGYAKAKLQECVARGLCTYLATGSSWVHQSYYACHTCHEYSVLKGNVGACERCAQACHKGHRLEKREDGPFWCDCGIGGWGETIKCQCLGDAIFSTEETERAAAVLGDMAAAATRPHDQVHAHGHHHHHHHHHYD